MPAARPIPLVIPPGVVKDEAGRATEGRYTDAQWMRFVAGRAEKRGGFTRLTSAVTTGVPRAMMAWRDLSQQDYFAAGTASKLYVYDQTLTQHDVTPIERSGTLGSNPFTTVNGSSVVTVAHTSHGRTSGSVVIFSGAATFNSVNMNGTWTVLTVTANTYTVQYSGNASAGSSGGGASVAYKYELNVGAEAGAYQLGYGVGGYGLSTYGTARTVSTLILEPRIWSLQNYGEDLYASYNTGTIYTLDPGTLSTNGRALALSNAPTDVRGMFITDERFVMALCEDMVVRWPDQEDTTDWTPTAANTANERRLRGGTKLISGTSVGQNISLVWSDNALHLFQYTGASGSVFSSRTVAENCGLVSPMAKCKGGSGIVYWMSPHSFHLYAGSVSEMPNVDDIKTFVFDNLRTDQPYLCWAYYDPKFDEVNFFYVPEGTLIPELSVAYSVKDQVWTPSDWSASPRASATRFQHGDTRPYLGGTDGYVYLYEDGYNGAAGAAIEAYIEWAPVEAQDGVTNTEIDGVRMDIKGQVGNLTVELSAYDTLRGGVIDSHTETIATTDELFDTRLAGRLIGGRITSDAVDGFFRMGKPIVLVRDGGARR